MHPFPRSELRTEQGTDVDRNLRLVLRVQPVHLFYLHAIMTVSGFPSLSTMQRHFWRCFLREVWYCIRTACSSPQKQLHGNKECVAELKRCPQKYAHPYKNINNGPHFVKVVRRNKIHFPSHANLRLKTLERYEKLF